MRLSRAWGGAVKSHGLSTIVRKAGLREMQEPIVLGDCRSEARKNRIVVPSRSSVVNAPVTLGACIS
eukprot:6002131-Pyramimonas_sp.AAC.1